MGNIMTEILKCFDLHIFKKHHSINKKNSMRATVDLIEMYLQESDEKIDEKTDEKTDEMLQKN